MFRCCWRRTKLLYGHGIIYMHSSVRIFCVYSFINREINFFAAPKQLLTEHKSWVQKCLALRQQIGARLEVLASLADKQIATEDTEDVKQVTITQLKGNRMESKSNITPPIRVKTPPPSQSQVNHATQMKIGTQGNSTNARPNPVPFNVPTATSNNMNAINTTNSMNTPNATNNMYNYAVPTSTPATSTYMTPATSPYQLNGGINPSLMTSNPMNPNLMTSNAMNSNMMPSNGMNPNLMAAAYGGMNGYNPMFNYNQSMTSTQLPTDPFNASFQMQSMYPNQTQFPNMMPFNTMQSPQMMMNAMGFIGLDVIKLGFIPPFS